MCILFIAVEQHPNYPLIIAANRDEFFARPTRPSHFWSEPVGMIAGQDLQAGGTWMGATRSGHLSALTNIRAPERQKEDARSRGELAINYLCAPGSDTFEHHLHSSKGDYNGYNLLYGHWRDLKVYNNFDDQIQSLTPGFYGLSNANLNSPWPKINRGVTALQEYCTTHDKLNHQALFTLLRDETLAEDHLLPQTGVPYEWEKTISAIFIKNPTYGTRTSTLVTVDNCNNLYWHERHYDNQVGIISDVQEQFALT